MDSAPLTTAPRGIRGQEPDMTRTEFRTRRNAFFARMNDLARQARTSASMSEYRQRIAVAEAMQADYPALQAISEADGPDFSASEAIFARHGV